MAISKAQRKQQQSAADAFDAFFVHEYGAERWGKHAHGEPFQTAMFDASTSIQKHHWHP